jgi:hypothetical protein
MKSVGKLITYTDYISDPIQFNYKEDTRMKTIWGGFLTSVIGIFTVVSIFFICL